MVPRLRCPPRQGLNVYPFDSGNFTSVTRFQYGHRNPEFEMTDEKRQVYSLTDLTFLYNEEREEPRINGKRKDLRCIREGVNQEVRPSGVNTKQGGVRYDKGWDD